MSSHARFCARRASAAAALLLAAASSAPRGASAQTSADVSLARQLGNEGLDLAAAGDCRGAIEKLKRAEGLYHAATTLTVLGECHVAVGKLVDGVEELTRVVREDLGPSSPAAFRKAQARARLKLEEARPRVPKLKVVVEGAHSDTSLSLKIDGQPVPVAALGLDRAVDPGAHEVEVTAPGYETTRARVTLKEGASETVKLALEPLPSPPPSAVATSAPRPEAAPRAEPPAQPAQPGPRHASRVPAYLSFGVGATGLAVGTILGLSALSKASHLDSACHPRSACPASEQGEIDAAKATSLGSTIAFGVGVVGVGLGTYFLINPPGEPSPETAALRVRPWIGLAAAGVDGSF